MTGIWSLPTQAVIGGKTYAIHGDFRDILEIFSCLEDPDMPEFLRWRVAIALFYEEDIPEKDLEAAARFLVEFIHGGREPQPGGARLLDWEQDGAMIVADVNRVAGQEIRALPFVHWWTFLSWFHAVGEGQLSTVVALRHKLARGKPLEKWEQEFYRENKALVDLKKRRSREELAEMARLEELLGGE